ncbi:MAG: right-handed parallel beta-helix repeat-containing protein, partial [Gemmataceae bacterium]
GFETGLVARNCKNIRVEGCDFSDNFHDPEFGWGESGRRGGMVLDRVSGSTLRKNRANRVWDGCVLLNSDASILEGNDFSRTSNTCLKLWTACRNRVQGNNLSYGIRIKPGEVHARDSTSVLIESGSNGNRFVDNDCTHGGDGIFIRVLNGWCSTGNHFEGNDCSHANNNAVECWAPRNTFVRNKANHSSYGFWMGGSDQSRLIDNEASFNGLPSGQHNSPHLPGKGHAGIALIGDLASRGKKWRAYHWVIEGNTLVDNRWHVYAKHADWVELRGNQYRGSTERTLLLDGDVNYLGERHGTVDGTVQPPVARLTGPGSVRVGQPAVWTAEGSSDPAGRALRLFWDKGDGVPKEGKELKAVFTKPGFQRIGLNVDNGVWTELAWRDVYVVREVVELGTEGTPADWGIEDFQDRARSGQQTSKARFFDSEEHLVGKSALGVEILPYAGFRAALTYPKKLDARWKTTGTRKLSFWLKAINEDVTGWQGGPFVVLHGEGGKKCYLEPKKGKDLMREMDQSEAREGWRLFEIPLAGDERWQVDGGVPETLTGVSLCFDSWGAPALRLWVDGLALE